MYIYLYICTHTYTCVNIHLKIRLIKLTNRICFKCIIQQQTLSCNYWGNKNFNISVTFSPVIIQMLEEKQEQPGC